MSATAHEQISEQMGTTDQLQWHPAPTQRELRVILAVNDPETVEWLRYTLAEHPLVRVAAEAHDGVEAAQLAHQLQPDLCLVQADLPVMDGYATCELLTAASPHVATVLVFTAPPGPGAERIAMGTGARGVVTVGTGAGDLLAALADIASVMMRRDTQEFAQATDLAHMPSIVGVSAGKGGVGKTTIACNLAVAMAQECPGKTVLVDLYTQYGDAALLLGLAKPGSDMPGIADIAARGLDIDAEFVESHLLNHSSGLRVLPGGLEPDLDTPMSPEAAGRLLSILRREFSTIIVDVPPVITPTIAHVISRCQQFLVVCNFKELTTLRDTKLLLDGVVDRFIDGDRIKLIGNRLRRKNRYLVAEFEGVTGYPVVHTLPDAPDTVVEAIDAGVPFVIGDPESPVSHSVRELADAMVPVIRTPQRRSSDRRSPAKRRETFLQRAKRRVAAWTGRRGPSTPLRRRMDTRA